MGVKCTGYERVSSRSVVGNGGLVHVRYEELVRTADEL